MTTTGQAKPDIDRDPMWHRAYMDVQAVLDKALGTEEEDGAGSGIAGDVALLAAQRDQARAEAARLARRLKELTKPGLFPAVPDDLATPEQMLREFHASKAIHGGLMPSAPTSAIPEWVRDLRMALLTEEVRELYDAAMAGDIVGIADGIADVAYVVTGTAVAYGIPFDAVFAEVHRSNMTKVNTPSEAKLVKGPGYEPPDIAGVLGLGGTADQFAAAYEPAATGAAARVFGAVATKPCGCGPDEPCGAHAEAGPPDDTTCARTAAPDGTRERTGAVPPLDCESLRGIVGNAVADWWTAPAPSKKIADALWPLLEHMQSAAAGSHEGVRLWMLDCGELVRKHRDRADASEVMLAEVRSTVTAFLGRKVSRSVTRTLPRRPVTGGAAREPGRLPGLLAGREALGPRDQAARYPRGQGAALMGARAERGADVVRAVRHSAQEQRAGDLRPDAGEAAGGAVVVPGVHRSPGRAVRGA